MSSDVGSRLSPRLPDMEALAEALRGHGYAILDQSMPVELGDQLLAMARRGQQRFAAAGVGRGRQYQLQHSVRSDRIQWLEVGMGDPVATYLAMMDRLREGLNRSLFLGLNEFEAHFAHYAPGTLYQRHRDAFVGNASRKLSSVLYLNPDWPADAGGELLLYADDSDQVLERVVPEMGRLVLFLSEEFPHQVLPARQDRYSIAGWFRVRSAGSSIEPA